MRPGASLLVVATFAMVLAAVSPGVGFVAASVSHAVSPNGAGVFSTVLVGSFNWAGYAGTGNDQTVTKVSGTWTQPTVNCASGHTSYVATWVGIDGFNTSDLVQTGTQGVCTGHSASYGAWWEVLPAPETPISTITVHAGDKITASVTYSSSTHKFSMKITDGSSTFTKTKSVSGTSRNSAECILERPLVGGVLASLAKYGTDKFSSCTATIGGVSAAIGSSPTVYQINMVNNADTAYISVTSALSSGKAFKETWKGFH